MGSVAVAEKALNTCVLVPRTLKNRAFQLREPCAYPGEFWTPWPMPPKTPELTGKRQ